MKKEVAIIDRVTFVYSTSNCTCNSVQNNFEDYFVYIILSPQLKHLKLIEDWWNVRKGIEICGFFKAKKSKIDEIKERNYNLDLRGYPHKEETILPPMELLKQYQEKRVRLDKNIDDILAQIKELIGDTNGN